MKNNLQSFLLRLQCQQILISSSTSSSSSNIELAISSIIQFFEFDRFRKLQYENIKSFLSRQNTLTILRTGSEKSLIYAIASILFQELIIVLYLKNL